MAGAGLSTVIVTYTGMSAAAATVTAGAITGAAVGAVSSAIQGGDVGMGALIGGVGGGVGGAIAGPSSGALSAQAGQEAANQAASNIGSAFTGGAGGGLSGSAVIPGEISSQIVREGAQHFTGTAVGPGVNTLFNTGANIAGQTGATFGQQLLGQSVGGLISAGGNLMTAGGQLAEGHARASVADFRAADSRQLANFAAGATARDLQEFQRSGSALSGTRRARAAASGKLGSTGAPLRITDNLTREIAFQSALVEEGGFIQQTSLLNSALSFEAQRDSLLSSSRLRAGGTVLTGAGRLFT